MRSKVQAVACPACCASCRRVSGRPVGCLRSWRGGARRRPSKDSALRGGQRTLQTAGPQALPLGVLRGGGQPGIFVDSIFFLSSVFASWRSLASLSSLVSLYFSFLPPPSSLFSCSLLAPCPSALSSSLVLCCGCQGCLSACALSPLTLAAVRAAVACPEPWRLCPGCGC